MTTIAYKDGILAADTLIVRGAEPAYGATKIFRTNKFLVGVSGSYANVLPFYHWLRTREGNTGAGELYRYWDEVPDYGDGFCAILVDDDGRIWSVVDAPPICINADFDAIGTGGKFAMGAMAAGASAADAVRIARDHDINTGGNIIRLNLAH